MSSEIFRKTSVREVVTRLSPVLKRYYPHFALGLFFILLSTGVEIVLPLIIGKSVDIAIADARDYHLLKQYCILFLGLIVFKAGVETVQAYIIQATGQNVTHDSRSQLFTKIHSLPIAYFDQNPTGRLLTRVVNDIKAVSELFTASMSVLALDFLIIFGTIIAMFVIHWRLAGLVLFTFPLVLYSIRYFGHQLASAYRRVRTKLAEINAFLGENIAAIATIQRLGAEHERDQKFTAIVEGHQVAQMDSVRVYSRVQPATNILQGIGMGTLIAVGGYGVIHGQLTMGMLVAFLGYLRNLFQPIRDLVEKYNIFLSAMVSAERVVGILEEPNETETGSEIVPENKSIRFEKVTFHYPLRQLNALEEVTFEVEEGKSLAIVGPTGGGKSTLIRLLLRFYEPTSGKIYFGGRDLSDWNREKLRQQIGVVHQEIYLFQGTIRENLTMGRAEFSDSFLKEQCERAQLWDFIVRRGGLDLIVFEGGTNLSIGERQLLSLARILVVNPPVLILDEATSSIDRRLEQRLMHAFDETIAGRTSIVIAHRLSTIRKCNGVILIQHGKIGERGTYESLMHAGGLFQKFHEIHSRI